MIILIIRKQEEVIKEISIFGHSQNIVCAAISTLIPATVNYIFLLENDTIDYIDQNGVAIIQVIEDTKYNQMFLQQMIKMIRDIQEEYPQEIILKEESK